MYGEASGQIVNHQKSSVIFVLLISDSTKTEVKSVLGIDREGGKGSYMSLLKCYRVQKEISLVSLKRQFKASLLNCYFREVKKIRWSQVGLSPSLFEMSCSKLPKDEYSKLISAMIELWWSSETIRRKFIWVAWQSYVTIRRKVVKVSETLKILINLCSQSRRNQVKYFCFTLSLWLWWYHIFFTKII